MMFSGSSRPDVDIRHTLQPTPANPDTLFLPLPGLLREHFLNQYQHEKIRNGEVAAICLGKGQFPPPLSCVARRLCYQPGKVMNTAP